MSKFKLTQTATEVQNILNNSLQKPTGLSKTKLVGVGVNGQENIEIGDNLTLANGKLSAATVNGLESDAEGNLTASKDLKVDGKLKLQSLVSASNPDGDIRKSLNGDLTLYRHHITIYSTEVYGYLSLEYYASTGTKFNRTSFAEELDANGITATGLFRYQGEYSNVISLARYPGSPLSIGLFVPSKNNTATLTIQSGSFKFRDNVYQVQ